MSSGEDNDSDVPEEFTAKQGEQQFKEIRKVQTDHKARVVRERKERRRLWAQKITPRPKGGQSVQDEVGTDTHQESTANQGMLPSNIVQLLADREKQVFSSDSEDDEFTEAKPTPKKKKIKIAGVETVILKEKPPSQCLNNSLEFLKKRKMQVPRSSSVLNNSNQALRLLSTSGLLTKK